MKFAEALFLAGMGGFIQRKSWTGSLEFNDDNQLVWTDGGRIVVFGSEPDEVSYEDLNAEDWRQT